MSALATNTPALNMEQLRSTSRTDLDSSPDSATVVPSVSPSAATAEGTSTTAPAPPNGSLPPTPQSNYGKLANLSPWRRACINTSLMIGLLFSIMDTSIVSTSLLTISIDFNSLAKTTWVVLAYTLADLGLSTHSHYAGCNQLLTRHRLRHTLRAPL
jgi:hypothetical protein